MTSLYTVELGVLGPLLVRQGGAPVAIPGAKPRAILTMLGLHDGSVVSADALVELLWGEDPPRTSAKALQTHVSALRRTLGDGFVLTHGTGWALAESAVDASRYESAARLGRDASATGDVGQAVARFEEALALWRGIPELPDGRRGTSEKTRWIEGHAALVEDRADALLATGRAAEIIGELEAAVAEAPLRERRWGQLMLALYRAGRQGDALGAYQRARVLLADELGVDPGPELRRLDTAIVAQDASLDVVVAQHLPSVMRAVTFLLTDIEGSTATWEADATAMALALARHDELIEQVVRSRGGRLIKTRGEGDATFSVFDRPSAAGAAAIELQDAITHEPWALREPMRIRIALHTGEVEVRDGDYFGRAVNRAARLRSLAVGGQILCSGATAELVIDSLPDDVVLADLGLRELRNLARPEHVFELRLETSQDVAQPPTREAPPMERPGLPSVLIGSGPFVGRGSELERLSSAWQTALAGGACAALIAGEPGVGKTRLAGEWSRQAHEQSAVVLYGRCDEDLGAPYQPFAEALRSLVPCVGTGRLRGLRGVEALLPLVPGLTDVVPDLAAPTRADPDTERYALFDAVVALLELTSKEAPVVLVLDDLHWAAKPTLLLLRHVLRFGDHARVQIVGTYRSTDLDRSHPLAAMLADLHRDGTANRISLSGLDEDDVSAYVAKAGYDDEDLGHALAAVTGGNPFFLIEALRHVDESGGVWDPSTLPQGVREAVSRRLSRLPIETNKALGAAAVVGSRFALDLLERVVGDDLVDAFDEAAKAGIVIEEPGGRYRFNHAIVRQSLLAELPSMRRMRLHQRIAMTLEDEPGADDERLAELAHHYFECAWAGNAAKAVEYCRRAADQAMARLAYEGAADLYDHALHALDEIDDDLPDRDDRSADLLVARCEALLAAGDVASAAGAVSQLQQATIGSARLSAWATCFDGQLSVLVHPERLDDVEAELAAAARKLAEIDDAAGEAKAHTVRATCLARLGRIGDCEIALDDVLTAARRAREHRRVNAVLAGAPLAALWGPNPVPRAGGRCLDVVRLLRITTDSPAVEATSTRCQAVLEAFRGRDAAARRMIDSARRTVTELGLRHALLEVEQFAGIVELVLDDPAAAEPRLRKAYNGFRRMGLDADTAETAALLGRACMALDRDAEADELCTESERLAGHALKASIAWRTLRAQLLSHSGDHEEARRVAEAAVTLAERTDGLVDHGDACLALATVLGAADDLMGARAAAERAADLYERKGAAALVGKARRLLGERPALPAPPKAPNGEPSNACVHAGNRLINAVNREAWDEVEQLLAARVSVESRRKIVGFPRSDVPSSQWPTDMRGYLQTGMVRYRGTPLAVRGERLALFRLEMGTADLTLGAPQDEMLQVAGIDQEGRIALQVKFDVEDIDAALTELDAAQARFEEVRPQARRLDNAASRVLERYLADFAAHDWDAMAQILAVDNSMEDRRRVVNAGVRRGRDENIANMRAVAGVGVQNVAANVIATRGERLVLGCVRVSGGDQGLEPFETLDLHITEINEDGRIVGGVVFDLDDFDAAIAELDARYLAGEAASLAHAWSVIAGACAALNRHGFPATAPDWINIDHRGETAFSPDDLVAYIQAGLDQDQDVKTFIEAVHQLSHLGAVVTYAAHRMSKEGFDAEWRGIAMSIVEGEMVGRSEVFDEADLGAAVARFDQLSRPAPRLENAASHVNERLLACFSAREWKALADILAEDITTEDRRRAVNAGVRQDRDAEIKDFRSAADLGVTHATSNAIATRGERLALTRCRYAHDVEDSGAFSADLLGIVEINADDRIEAWVLFDLDDIDDAIAELDARYLAGEAATHAHTWSVIAESYAAVNRQEFPAVSPDSVFVDHRRAAAFGASDLSAYLRAGLDLGQDLRPYVEAVHRLNDLGAVFTHVGKGTSRDGFEAKWRTVDVMTVEDDLISRGELFDEADVDAAIARLDQISLPVPRLENAASRANARFMACVNQRDWDAIASIMSDDHHSDDRRRITGTGIRRGREAEIENARVVSDLGAKLTVAVIATRGERLALTRNLVSFDEQQQGFVAEVLGLVETDLDGRVATAVMYDLADIEAAFEELDAWYLSGEAAAHAHTWSLISGSYAAVNRHEMPLTTPDCAHVDHRRQTAMGVGDLIAYISAGPDRDQDKNKVHVEAVHRLTEHGAVVTYAAHETSREGFDAEWCGIAILTVDGELINRTEVFDEADVDAAIARFEWLSQPTQRLENTASQVTERFAVHLRARDWDAMAELLADDVCSDDRRGVVGAGTQHGRDAHMADMRTIVDLWITNVSSTIIATRGTRLVLVRTHFSGSDQGPGAFLTEVFGLVEIDTDTRIAAIVSFDLDDFDAAIAELDARYLAGEAAPHARTWSAIMQGYASLNRRELPPTTPDWVNIDHRRGTSIAPGAIPELLTAAWNVTSDLSHFVEAVHRLDNLGGVVTSVANETSPEGFHAEWRVVSVFTVEGDVVNRLEVFDEANLDTALARFDELQPRTPRLDNKASQVGERYRAYFAAGSWDAMADIIADDFVGDDRRRVVGSGVRIGRDAQIADMRAIADLFIANMTWTDIAIRGDRLVLFRVGFLDRDHKPDAFRTEVLCVLEIDADDRIVASISFDLDDVDAAFEELDARYLAGEAATHAYTWSVITRGNAAANRHETFPMTPDSLMIDHRLRTTLNADGLTAYVRASWDLTPNLHVFIESVHRLSDLGAVVTQVSRGTSQDDFDAEWRQITLFTLDGDSCNRCEIFDEANLDAALARFEELHPLPRLENAAHQVSERFLARFVAGDWDAMAKILAPDFSSDDRRRVVGAGVRHGRDAEIADMRAIAELWNTNATSEVIATRGGRLVLSRFGYWADGEESDEFLTEVLSVIAINAEQRIAASATFDTDDIDAAFAELDARYLAGEAAPSSQTWSVITRAYAAFNRHELPATEWAAVDRRRATPFESSTMTEILLAIWDLTPDLMIHVEAVHRLDSFGAVITHTASGSSPEGFAAEWRAIDVLTVEGDRITGCDIFDEADLGAALIRFEELHLQTPRPENAATRADQRFWTLFAARDWDAVAELLADDISTADRRRFVNSGVRHGRDEHIAEMRAVVEVGIENITSTIVATRGSRLALTRICGSDRETGAGELSAEVLTIVEINAHNRISARVGFDVDDAAAAFDELDARYLTGEAAGQSHTWSLVANACAAINRHELPELSSDCVNLDHRRAAAFGAGEMTAYLHDLFDDVPDIHVRVEVVHRLGNVGAVVSLAGHGTSQAGFQAEWREIGTFLFDGDLLSRFELFDEADLDATLARFAELDGSAS